MKTKDYCSPSTETNATSEPTGEAGSCGQASRDAHILGALDNSLVYYGPHPCESCGRLICRTSKNNGAALQENGLPEECGGISFDYPEWPIYPNTNWTVHVCQGSLES